VPECNFDAEPCYMETKEDKSEDNSKKHEFTQKGLINQ